MSNLCRLDKLNKRLIKRRFNDDFQSGESVLRSCVIPTFVQFLFNRSNWVFSWLTSHWLRPTHSVWMRYAFMLNLVWFNRCDDSFEQKCYVYCPTISVHMHLHASNIVTLSLFSSMRVGDRWLSERALQVQHVHSGITHLVSDTCCQAFSCPLLYLEFERRKVKALGNNSFS